MVEKLKININKIFIALTLMLTLIGITFISTRTYAYTIDDNGNLVGDNLLSIYDKETETRNGITTSCINQHIKVSGLSTANTNFTIDIEPITIEPNVDYTFKFFGTLLPDNQRYVLYFYDNTNYLQTSAGFDGQTSYFTLNVNQQMILDDIIIFSLTDVDIVINGYIEILRGLYSNDSLTSWEPYGVWYSEFNYNTLDNNYNELYNYNKYGWLRYIDNLEIYINSEYKEDFNFNELTQNGYITNNKINVYNMSLYQNPNYSNSRIDIYFSDSIKNIDTFNYNLFSLTSNGDYASSIVSIYDNEDHVATFEFSNEVVAITPEAIMNKNKLFNGDIYNITIYNSSPDTAINYYTDSNYGNGYQSGYNYGRTIGDIKERELNDIIKEKNNQIEQLEIDKQQAYNNGYTTGYNEGNTSGNSLYNMVIRW